MEWIENKVKVYKIGYYRYIIFTLLYKNRPKDEDKEFFKHLEDEFVGTFYEIDNDND